MVLILGTGSPATGGVACCVTVISTCDVFGLFPLSAVWFNTSPTTLGVVALVEGVIDGVRVAGVAVKVFFTFTVTVATADSLVVFFSLIL